MIIYKGVEFVSTRCFIAGAGEYCGFFVPSRDDYIIAADGGYSELISRGIIPDLVVGDFDSLGRVPDHPNILQSPEEKDDTDMMIAVKQGFARGCETFFIDGGLGGRIDHTFANFQLLAYIAQRGAHGFILGRDITVTAINNSTISFNPVASGRISVFCAGSKAEGVTLTGLKYQLDSATLAYDYPLGISNEFIGAPAAITVCEGILIVMWTGGIEVFYAK